MRARAHVAISAVERFLSGVEEVGSQASNLNGCETTLVELYQILSDSYHSCEEEIESLVVAQSQAEAKIEEYDRRVNQILSEIETIEAKIDRIRDQMACTPEYITVHDDDGESHEESNPAYERLEERETDAEQELEAAEQRLNVAQKKLDRAKSVDQQVTSHLERMSQALRSLADSRNTVQRLREELSEIKLTNNVYVHAANDKLQQICRICSSYIALKMRMDHQSASRPADFQSGSAVANESSAEKSFTKDIGPGTEVQTPVAQTTRNENQMTDDNGHVYRVGNELVRNAEFQINGYTYKTDSNSRTIQVSGKLQMPQKRPRNMESMDVVGKGDQQATDDRGHLVGHQFNGSDRLENLVPQETAVNKGAYARLETRLADMTRSGNDVYVSVMPIYKGSRRPEAIFYYYCTDGYSSAVFFPNTTLEGRA